MENIVLIIKNQTKQTQPDGQKFIELTVHFVHNVTGNVAEAPFIEERKLAFPFTITMDELKVELKKYLELFKAERTPPEPEVDPAEQNADAIIEQVKGGFIE